MSNRSVELNCPPASVDIVALIDSQRAGKFQLRIVVICAIIFAIDGFDVQAAAFSLGAISDNWNISPAAMGPVLGATIVGFGLGSLICGFLADKLGRRVMLLAATGIFGAFTLAAATSTGVWQLAFWRLLAGVGLGGAIPNLIALTAELSPASQRTKLITLMSCGYALGGAASGVASAFVLPAFGWKALFAIGGMLPLALLPVLYFFLPESPRFLVEAGRQNEAHRLVSALRGYSADVGTTRPVYFLARHQSDSSQSISQTLLGRAHLRMTLLIWLLFFVSVMTSYLLMSWIPVLLMKIGGTAHGSVGGALLQVGALCGVILGWAADRFGPARTLVISYSLATVLMILSTLPPSPHLFFIWALGIFVLGTQYILNATAAAAYPTSARSTGVGWALGVGRMGALFASTFGGSIIGTTANAAHFFIVGGALCASAAILSLFLSFAHTSEGKG